MSLLVSVVPGAQRIQQQQRDRPGGVDARKGIAPVAVGSQRSEPKVMVQNAQRVNEKEVDDVEEERDAPEGEEHPPGPLQQRRSRAPTLRGRQQEEHRPEGHEQVEQRRRILGGVEKSQEMKQRGP